MVKAKDAIAAARSDRHTIQDRELDCYKDTDGTVYRCLLDNTVHDAKALPTSLEVVS